MSREYVIGILNVISLEEYSSIFSVTLLSNITNSWFFVEYLVALVELLVFILLVGANVSVIFTCNETKGIELPLEIIKLDMSPAWAVAGGLKVTST